MGAPADRLRVVRDIESAMLSTWPAPRTVIDGTWIARFAGGYTKRANSLNCLDPDDAHDTEPRLDWIESLYRQAGLPAIARITPLTPPSVDALLQERGYQRRDASVILTASLRDVAPAVRPAPPDHLVHEGTAPSLDWLAAHEAVSAAGDAIDRHRAILNALTLPRLFLSLTDPGQRTVACMLAVLHRHLFTIHDVATAPGLRRKGFARLLIERARQWALANGGAIGWIAVQAGNKPALSLFCALGYEPCYRYHYRCGADPS